MKKKRKISLLLVETREEEELSLKVFSYPVFKAGEVYRIYFTTSPSAKGFGHSECNFTHEMICEEDADLFDLIGVLEDHLAGLAPKWVSIDIQSWNHIGSLEEIKATE